MSLSSGIAQRPSQETEADVALNCMKITKLEGEGEAKVETTYAKQNTISQYIAVLFY